MGAIGNNAACVATLAAGVESLGLDLDADTQARLLRYLELMLKWNRVHNLTRITGPEAMVVQHLLDSLAVLPFVQGPRILDIGTGAGLPGIPLALVRPSWQLILLDSNNKKTRFLNQVKIDLNLSNVQVIHGRMEKIQSQALCDTVISRAVGQITDIVTDARHFCTPAGVMIFMKGQYPAEELEAAAQAGIHYEVSEISVPGLDARRHIITVRNQDPPRGEHS